MFVPFTNIARGLEFFAALGYVAATDPKPIAQAPLRLKAHDSELRSELRRLSERLAELENKESKNITKLTMITSSDSIPTQKGVTHQDETPRNKEKS
ncbi:hypothetical protein FVEG_15901 [Fusarium verticillioides 7600]|uniref:Uncharacterized protein n=1 Tax=Gibberella moniliformis (strain M3125 / FGSC 7600) TaxID=334819 RepID=W7MED0_GIBM7|nr:hypothetical protein FVEG_15901 [Fusarium verticillioides 7600]EWG45984.1 hypothetical protein FVEG_15901 [Fusarium verticillioides 7600]